MSQSSSLRLLDSCAQLLKLANSWTEKLARDFLRLCRSVLYILKRRPFIVFWFFEVVYTYVSQSLVLFSFGFICICP